MVKRRRLELYARRDERKTIKKTVYFSILSIILAILLFTFGVGTLAKFAEFLDVLLGKNQSSQTADKNAPIAPKLDDLPEATNSADLPVTGFSQGAIKVFIYKNSEKVGEAKVDGLQFEYKDLTLKEGDNEITAISVGENDRESPTSDAQKVTLDTKEPSLTVESPTEGQSFSGNNRIIVSGKTEKDVQVTANGFLANINSAEGKFEVAVPLKEGDNDIEVKATDPAGNTKSQKLRVHFSK